MTHNDTGSEWEAAWKKIRAEGVDEPMSEFYAKVETLLRTIEQKAREEERERIRRRFSASEYIKRNQLIDFLTPTNDNEN